MAKFAQVIKCLNKGENKEIAKQIPQTISKDVVPKMTSFPSSIKPKVSTVGNGEISYHDQVLQISFTDDGKTPAIATYYIPTWEDIFA